MSIRSYAVEDISRLSKGFKPLVASVKCVSPILIDMRLCIDSYFLAESRDEVNIDAATLW